MAGVTDADRRHFMFMRSLIRISDGLSKKETDDVKLYCSRVIPKGLMRGLKRAVDVFQKLEEIGKIDQENLDFVEEILEMIERQDLIRDVLRTFQQPDQEIPENPELELENPDLQLPDLEILDNPELEPENPESQPHDEEIPENPELEPENPESQPGTSQEGASAEDPAMSNIYTVVHGHSRMTQETVHLHRRNIASACNTRRSQVKFRGHKKHKSILAHYTVPRENTAVLRLMADHSDPRLVFMGMKSLQIDAGVPVKIQQESLLYDVKRQLPVDDIEVGCSTRKKQQRAPRSWTRLWALNLFSDALPLHLQVAASLEYQGFSYSLVRALAERDRLREHQMRRAVHNLRKAEVESNALRQKAEVDSNTLMTLRSKLNIAENRRKEALETNAVLEEKLQQAQEYAEKAARQVATHITATHITEDRGEKPPGGWPAQVEKADAARQQHLVETDGTTGRPEDVGDNVREELLATEEHRETAVQDSDSGGYGREKALVTGASEQERPQAGVEGVAPLTTGYMGQSAVTFGGYGSEPGKFGRPRGIVVSPSNKIFVTDAWHRRVQVLSIKGEYIHHFPTVVPGTEDRDMVPYDVCMDSNGTLWMVGRGEAADHVAQYSTDGTTVAGFDLQKISYSRGIAVDMRTNHILVTDKDCKEVEVFHPDGSLVRRFGHPEGEMTRPQYITVDGEGNILVSDRDSNSVYVFDESGKFLFKFGGWGKGEGQLRRPRGICTDREGNIIVADSENKRVQIFTRHGEYLRSIHTGPEPYGLAMGLEGQLLVTSRIHHTVTVFPNY